MRGLLHVMPQKRFVPAIGERFGRLVVTKELGNVRSGKQLVRMVEAECDCGNTTQGRIAQLRNGRKLSCGCIRRELLSAQRKDRTGERIGKLTFGKYVGHSKATWAYEMHCACGRSFKTAPDQIDALVKQGGTPMCPTCRGFEYTKRNRDHHYEGRTFGEYTVIRQWGAGIDPATGKAVARSLVQCSCGNQHIVRTGQLRKQKCCPECAHYLKGGDGLKRFRDNPEWANSDCYVYLANVNGKYIKPGISSNPEKRGRGTYSGFSLISPLLTRVEAWVIEQRLLTESKEARPIVAKDIDWGWGGYSELRIKSVLPASWFITRFWELLEEMQERGWEEMARALA